MDKIEIYGTIELYGCNFLLPFPMPSHSLSYCLRQVFRFKEVDYCALIYVNQTIITNKYYSDVRYAASFSRINFRIFQNKVFVFLIFFTNIIYFNVPLHRKHKIYISFDQFFTTEKNLAHYVFSLINQLLLPTMPRPQDKQQTRRSFIMFF